MLPEPPLPENKTSPKFLHLLEYSLLERGFRPFFLAGAAFNIICIFIWGAFYSGHMEPPDFLLDPVSWHAHEMIYGFVMAIVAGFLLTAVANWTGGAPARHLHLAGLCLLWLSGRIVMNVNTGLPFLIIFTIEILFIPALAISLAIPLIKSWNQRNFIFLALLSLLFTCDIWFLIDGHLTPLYLALFAILIMISLIGGRIIPAFTVASLRGNGLLIFQTPQPKMDFAALLSLGMVAVCLVFAKDSIALFFSALLSACLHALRMRHYHSMKIFGEPMLWILHAGYVWLVIGLLLLAVTPFQMVNIPVTLHALTTGSIGSMTLGMMCRVALGHTGRVISASNLTVISFISIQLAALIRVFGPLSAPEFMREFIIISAIFWIVSFMIYLGTYTFILVFPRADAVK